MLALNGWLTLQCGSSSQHPLSPMIGLVLKNFLLIISFFFSNTLMAGDPPFSITQNSDTMTILDEHSVACPTENDRYMRRFLLTADHGLGATLSISDVHFAVESSSAAITLTIGLYAIDVSDPLLLANLTPIGATTVGVSDLDDLQPVSVPLTANIDGLLNDLVVEISAPDLNKGVGFFVGSNAAGQTGPSYLVAPDCGAPEPTDIGTLKFPEVHIIMTVDGTISGPSGDVIFVDGFDFTGP